MVLDFDVICENLGIDKAALKRGGDRINALLWKIPDTEEAFINVHLSLPPDELLAIIRFEKLYKRYPDYFTYDGPTGKRP